MCIGLVVCSRRDVGLLDNGIRAVGQITKVRCGRELERQMKEENVKVQIGGLLTLVILPLSAGEPSHS